MKSNNASRVIAKSYLRGLAVKCALLFTAGIILTAVILFFAVQQPLGPDYGESFRIINQLKAEILFKSIAIYAATLLCIMAGIIILSLLYSHRVAGPIFRLSRFVRCIAGGDLSETVILRQKDVIQPLATELNNLVIKYRQSLHSLADKADDLKRETEKLKEEKDAGDTAESLTLIAGKAREIETVLDSVKL